MTSQKTALKTNIISPEVLEIKKKYSTTWNPSDKLQYFGDPKRIDLLKEKMEKIILDFPNTDLQLSMEVSRNGRLHFHGTISFNSFETIKDFYVNRIHGLQELFNIDIDNLKDEEVWSIYCSKSKNIFEEFVSTKSAVNKYRKVKVDKNGIAHKPFF